MLEYWIRSTWDGGIPEDEAEIKLTISSGISSEEVPLNEEKNTKTKERDLIIDVDAPLYNDPQVPSNIPRGSVDGLWDYEVVELFFLAENNKYLEIELAPSGHYLLLQLDGHPEKRLQYQLPLANYEIGVEGDRWWGQAIIPYNYLPYSSSVDINRFNAYAIHKSGRERVFMALYPVPQGKYEGPNFHRLEYFQPIDLSIL